MSADLVGRAHPTSPAFRKLRALTQTQLFWIYGRLRDLHAQGTMVEQYQRA